MININTKELLEILDIVPAEQNIMLVGKHGIGKSEILTKYFNDKGMKVVTLFLGQMSDPGDLIGLPTRDEATGHTTFMPPYWFPTSEKEPIVLFLDELNRARPEVLQTIMDLALNRRLAGRALPEGSRVISAVNDGDEYQLTDLDPALVSRFNIFCFRPSASEWLLWATKNGLDKRVTDFIAQNNEWLDGEVGGKKQIDTGLEKTPDRRAWKKVSDVIKGAKELDKTYAKVLAGIVGVKAANALISACKNKSMVSGEQVLLEFDNVKAELSKYKVHELTIVNDGIFRHIETNSKELKGNADVAKNLEGYVALISKGAKKEAMAEFSNIYGSGKYPKATIFISSQVTKIVKDIMSIVQNH